MGLMRISNFIKDVKKLENIENIEKTCLIEKQYIDNNYTTIGSRKYTYSKYRKALLDNKISDNVKIIIFNTLKLSSNELITYKGTYKEQIKKEQNNLKYIVDYKVYIEKALSLLEHNNFIDKVLGFSALTGRRVAEIGCTAKFDFYKSSHVIFTGQLKTKCLNNYDSYVIPVLTSPINLITHFNFFKDEYLKYLDKPDLFHNNCSKDLSVKVKKYFGDFVEGTITPKDLRAIYATIACYKFKENDRITDQSYIADILGHSDNDLNTCNSYFDYKIKEK